MKRLIVTADDFGYTHSVSQGIIEAHQKGIVTSTSVMVDAVAAEEAKELVKYPDLSVGLHFQITDEGLLERLKKSIKYQLISEAEIKAEIERQVTRFKEITGHMPTHIDGHHHMHTLPKIAPIMKAYAKVHNLPVRYLDDIDCIKSFFGWNALQQSSPNQISPDALIEILKQLPDGTTELMTHPGRVDDELINISRYSREREIELATLTSDRVREAANELGIVFVNRTGERTQ